MTQTLWSFICFETSKFCEFISLELKAKVKLPKRVCAKLTDLAQPQNSIEATAQDLRWQIMLICRET
ncbi:hypothetical protein BOO91_18795 [Vibrio navarrensis]|nr:hypothetical protein UF06_03715 [Vibrio sp. S234-5]MBE3654959.1 hypothetical protein [Vibrio navarrensis]MBE3662984.1 hypothetical protein [Vibrio navarrensis]